MTGTEHSDEAIGTVCYRHPDRSTGVTCQRCDRHICSSCMHQASVGSHCPECVASGKQKVYTRNNLPGTRTPVTTALIAINAAAFIAQVLFFGATAGTGGRVGDWTVYAIGIDVTDAWYRLLTGAFLHVGLIHLLVNLYSLYIIGPIMERRLGSARFGLAYLASLLGSSLAIVLLTPQVSAIGASGAIYGIGGLLIMMFRTQGVGLQQSGMMGVVIINVFINLTGAVSVAGHVGGLIVGLGLGAMYFGVNPGDQPLFGRDRTKPDMATSALIVALSVAAVFVAERAGDAFFGFPV